MNSFGESIKKLREKKDWPQRRLAYELDIDVSVLSRIENENKFPKKRIPGIIRTIAKIFDIREEELRAIYLSDEIASLVKYEEGYEDILKVSKSKVDHERSKLSNLTPITK